MHATCFLKCFSNEIYVKKQLPPFCHQPLKKIKAVFKLIKMSPMALSADVKIAIKAAV